MLSEEEKAVLKKLFEEVIQAKEKSDIRLKINKQVAQYLLNCINSSEQLESDKQDLIEKLQEKEIKINELEDRISLIETYYDISDLDEIVKNDI